MPRPEPKKHAITVEEAARICERHRSQATARSAKKATEGDLGGLFTKEEVVSMLKNPKARFLRFYYGENEKGGRELVLLAADADGNDLITDGSIALDSHWPCPPFCPEMASVLRG